ncbi:MAG TPA: response regulator [Parafilimonas sp.]|nr:response regulator [Parafilimonas sp.]
MIKAILIDDEGHCLDTLNILLTDYCPEVEVMELCASPKKGLDAIEKLKPELVFLDIEMPGMNGFELLQQFKEVPFSVIFTTSYDQYAIKAIKFSALDYLLKPIDPKELIAAVHKVQSQKATPGVEQLRALFEHVQGKDSGSRIAAVLHKNFPVRNQAVGPLKQRHLAAILFTDIVAYTALMEQNEVHAIDAAKRYISVLEKTVAAHSGEVLNDYGDGNLCIFSSATEAVHCALEIQLELQSEPAVPLRIGMHIGEILFQDGRVFGDGVNVASRIQSLGQANTILFSEEIQDKIKNNPAFKSSSLGTFEFKNVDKPVKVFALANEGLKVPLRRQMDGKLKKRSVYTDIFRIWKRS